MSVWVPRWKWVEIVVDLKIEQPMMKSAKEQRKQVNSRWGIITYQ